MSYMDTFEIYQYKYVDVNTRNKFLVYARKVEFADKLVERINALGVFNLRRAKIFFVKRAYSDIEPYVLEQKQMSVVEEWEVKSKNAKNS